MKFQLYKPDGNFIIKDADNVTSEYVEIELDEQTTASAGVGYADLKLTSNGVVIYTCHVSITIDTPVATDKTIVSLSMIDGYIFPDDFQLKLTAGANITITEDNVISSTGGGGGGTGDYQDLINKPKINNVILYGNKTTAQLGLPTKTSDLTNDSGFITSAVNDLINYYKRSETYTKAEVNDLLASLSSLNLEVVAALPDHDISTTTIYLVPKDVPSTDDVYDEYVYISNSWEKIGSTSADLSNYYTKAQADTLLSVKVDKVTGKGLSTNDFTNADVTKLNGIEVGAEVNVQADWNQTNVDADDYIKNKPSIVSYTAGNGIDITNNQISVTNLVLNHISENTEHIESLNQNLAELRPDGIGVITSLTTTAKEGTVVDDAFSNYDMILIVADDTGDARRASMILPMTSFTASSNNILTFLAGGQTFTMSVKYKTDTKFEAYLSASTSGLGITMQCKLYGMMKR